MTAPRLRVVDVEFGTRPIEFLLPFRFGDVTLTRCPQVYVRATVESEGRRAQGLTAELMVPRWFDKRADRSFDDNIEDLAASLREAGEAYRAASPDTAFGLFERHYEALHAQGARAGRTELSTGFGQALLDKAVLDGLCRLMDVSFFEVSRRNLIGLRPSWLAPDLKDLDCNAWLAARQPLASVEARHTVGMLDPLASEGDEGPQPKSLEGAIRRFGHRYFKLKLSGDAARDLDRVDAIAALLRRVAPDFRFSLDGNEQYRDGDTLRDFVHRFASSEALRRDHDALLYLEQPIAREQSFDLQLGDIPVPLLLDEADGSLDAFPRGREAGWRGVSSKSCKGLYKSMINRARCDVWNASLAQPRYFMSAEDLCCQPGLALQQDLALAAFLGLAHVERNGHHYCDGFSNAPRDEQIAFAARHPDLYDDASHPRLRIAQGRIAIRSLNAPGFASDDAIDFEALTSLA